VALHLYGTAASLCAQQLREPPEWGRRDFLEHDIEAGPAGS